MSRNIPGDYISAAERTQIRKLLDERGIRASQAQTMALLNEVDRLEALLRAAAEPDSQPSPNDSQVRYSGAAAEASMNCACGQPLYPNRATCGSSACVFGRREMVR